jgi:hypothetical protein
MIAVAVYAPTDARTLAVPNYMIFAEIGLSPTQPELRRPYTPRMIGAEDDSAAERVARAELGRLVMSDAAWVRVLVISQDGGQLVAELRHPEKLG